MQDRYVGDIGDFGKYGLLNCIGSTTRLRLGVNWYLTSPTKKEEKSGDGKLINYLLVGSDYADLLNDTEYEKRNVTEPYAHKIKDTDGELYNKLQQIIVDRLTNNNPDLRCVKQIEECRILPNGTIFYSEKLLNNTDRENWFDNSLKQLSESKLVFLDPDNGIDFQDKSSKSPKQVYLDEIESYFISGKSLIIYQHADRDKNGFDKVIEKKSNQLMNKLKLKKDQISCLRYKRISARAFFILMQQEHSVCITKAIDGFLETNWGKHKHFTKK